jgi:hypothetical protein
VDTWLRLLAAARFRVRPAYWPRLAAVLWTSLLGTAVTLPERLALAPVLWFRFARGPLAGALRDGPPVLVVLGYYRSGTTHLHYLLSCDPRFVTTRWHQVASPAGWWGSWTLLRAAMVPLTPNTRPQDEVAFGPDWPAEDDFALAGWAGASALPGRFVFPATRAKARDWHLLDKLSPREHARFARTLAAFCWKLTRPAGRHRRLLLKTPSHTARVRALRAVFGDRVRFVHITRDPEAVVRSNVVMAERLERFLLQDGPDAQTTRREIVDELEATERAFLEQSADLPPERLARLRYEDLTADPVAELRRVYAQLDLGWTAETELRVRAYLAGVAEYRPDTRPGAKAAGLGLTEAERAACERVRAMTAFDRPAAPSTPFERTGTTVPAAGHTRRAAYLAAPAVTLIGFAAWMLAAQLTADRVDFAVWLLGGLVGFASLRAAGRGSNALGLWAAAWVLLAAAAAVYPLPEISSGWIGVHRWRAIRTAYGSLNNTWVWIALGTLTTWRLASRRHLGPPGR